MMWGVVQIAGLVYFSFRSGAAVLGLNPGTGQAIGIAASKSVGFKPATAFKGTL